jgi:signal transduction histidine kinase
LVHILWKIDSRLNMKRISASPFSNPGCDDVLMIYDLPKVKGTLKPLPLAALDAVIALIVAIEIMIFDGYHQLRANTNEVSESQETVLAIEGVLRSILNTETRPRGFVINGDEVFLVPYHLGYKAFAAAIQRALDLTRARPEQLAHLEEVRVLESHWRTHYVEPLIANGGKINDALEVVRIRMGRAYLDQIRFRQRAGGLNQAYAQALSVRFVPDLRADHPLIYADPDRLMQVLTNLLSDAAKFLPRNKIVTLPCRTGGTNVRVEVRDRGPGIARDFRRRIFGKFAQVDSSDTRQKGGTGLGLSIARSFVEKTRELLTMCLNRAMARFVFVELPLHAASATATQPDQFRTA